MEDYQLSDHAKDVMKEREISWRWIMETIMNPTLILRDEVDGNLEHSLAPIPDFGERVLRVIRNVGANPKKVVTAYFDRKMRGKL